MNPKVSARELVLSPAGATIATLAFFWRVTFSGQVFVGRDATRGALPLKQFFASELHAHRFPQWYPFDALGQPFAGTVVSNAFDPLNIWYLLLSTPRAYTAVCLCGFAAAAFGAFCLARHLALQPISAALVAGLYAFAGPMVGLTNNAAYLLAAATLPFVAWAALALARAPSLGGVAPLGLSLALVLVAGDPESFVVSCAGAGVLVLATGGRARWPWLLGAWALAALIAAPQLTTALSAAREAAAGAQTLDEAQVWSGHPARMLEWAFGPLWLNDSREVLAPTSLGAQLEPSRGSLWFDSEHLGPAALLLAACSFTFLRSQRAVRWISLGAGVVFLLWLGRNAPLYAVVYELVPPWRPFRYPEKLLPFIFLFLTLAAGAGLAKAFERKGVFVIVASAAAACALAGLAGFQPRCLFESAGSLAVLAIALRLKSKALAVLATLAPLVLWGGHLALAADPSVLEQTPRFVTTVHARAGNGLTWVDSRVGSVDLSTAPEGTAGALLTEALLQTLRPDVVALYGLGSRDAYFPAATKRSKALAAIGRDSAFIARFAITQTEDVRPGETVVDADEDLGLKLVERPALPEVSLRSYRCVPSLDAARSALDARTSVDEPSVAECEGDGIASALGSVQLLKSTPSASEVSIATLTGGLVVFSSAFAQGWSAELDGAPTPIVATDIALRGVRVSEGPHRLKMTYREPGLDTGLLLGAMGLVVFLALVLIPLRRRDRASPAGTETNGTSARAPSRP